LLSVFVTAKNVAKPMWWWCFDPRRISGRKGYHFEQFESTEI